jgi:hypothetical protein
MWCYLHFLIFTKYWTSLYTQRSTVFHWDFFHFLFIVRFFEYLFSFNLRMGSKFSKPLCKNGLLQSKNWKFPFTPRPIILGNFPLLVFKGCIGVPVPFHLSLVEWIQNFQKRFKNGLLRSKTENFHTHQGLLYVLGNFPLFLTMGFFEHCIFWFKVLKKAFLEISTHHTVVTFVQRKWQTDLSKWKALEWISMTEETPTMGLTF